jgi:hypothetical protein
MTLTGVVFLQQGPRALYLWPFCNTEFFKTLVCYDSVMTTYTFDIHEARRLILGRMTYRDAATKLGTTELTLLNALRHDPEVALARSQGLLNAPKRKLPADHFRSLPHVQAVLGGMSQVEAARVYGKAQPQISRDLKRAVAESQSAGKSASGGEPVWEAAATLLRAAAVAAGMAPAELAGRVAKILEAEEER